MWSGGALQLWGPLFTDMHIEIHKHAPWGAPWWICDGGERLGDMEEGSEGEGLPKEERQEGFLQTPHFPSPDATDFIPRIFPKY